jgi:Mg2+/Co2+ transporter CorC
MIERKEIIRMAREAEAWNLIDHDGIAALERFAALIAAHEREECAKVCELVAINACDKTAQELSFAIRARGEA